MTLHLIHLLLAALAGYLCVGLVAACWLHLRLPRIDSGVRGAGLAFRILVTPGLVALWPLLVRRALRGGTDAFPDPDQPVRSASLRRSHGVLIRMLAVAAPLVFALALAGRREMPAQRGPLPPGVREPLPVVRTAWINGEGAVRHRLRSDRYGWRWQVEVAVSGQVPFDDAMVYWMSGREEGGPAQFVGSIPGAGTHRYAIPPELAEGGHFVVLSVSRSRALARAGG